MESEMINLYNNLHEVFSDGHGKILQFIGSSAGVGVTTVVKAFGTTLATEFGKSVLRMDSRWYVDAPETTSAEPQIHHLSTMDLRDGNDLRVGIQGTDVPGVSVCRSSTESSSIHLASVLASPGLDRLFGSLREQFDVTLIDTEPASISPESLLLARRVDGVVLVISGSDSRWSEATATSERLAKTGCEVLGIVFNKKGHYLPRFLYRLLS